jgi:prevent-host-death family protein
MSEAVNVHEAKTHFSRLLERVNRGEEIVIAKAGKPVAHLVPYGEKPAKRVPGTAKGQVFIILGRLIVPDDPESYLIEQIQRNAFQPLPIQLRHSLHRLALPPLYKDPFDRMLIAQALFEHLPILTSDKQIVRYPVEVIWS